MRSVAVVASVILALLAGSCSSDVQRQPTREPIDRAPPPEQPAAGDGTPGTALAEETVPYDSTTMGALKVQGVDPSPVDWYAVFRDGKPAVSGSPPLLGATVELPPGPYVVEVNRVRREVAIEAGRLTVLRCGSLRVDGGSTGAFWYPRQGTDVRLSDNPPLLGKSRQLLPGTYTVLVHVGVEAADRSLGEVEILPGESLVLQQSSP